MVYILFEVRRERVGQRQEAELTRGMRA